MAVEGKAGEEFDKRLVEWLGEGSIGKENRLKFLCDTLGLKERPNLELRYQLFHRAVSAIIEARRWRIPTALMLVQSFAESPTAWNDYVAFAALLNVSAVRNDISSVRALDKGIALHLGWVDSEIAPDDLAAKAV